jgi:hypothetical protein
MAVRGVARDEDAALPVGVGDGDAQVPEADVVEFDGEGRPPRRGAAGRFEVEVVLRGAEGHGAWKNQLSPGPRGRRTASSLRGPGAGRCRTACRDSAPAARAARSSGRRAAPSSVVVGGSPDAGGCSRTSERLPSQPTIAADRVSRVRRSRDRGDGDAVPSSLEPRPAPAVEGGDRGKLRGAGAQHAFGRVLGQALVVGEVEGAHEGAVQPVVVPVATAACRRRHARRCRIPWARCGRRAARARSPRSGSVPSCAGSGSGPWGSAAARVALDHGGRDTPRWPSSMASPMPTGPPPTMMTSNSFMARIRPAPDPCRCVWSRGKSFSPSGPCRRPRPDWP